MEATRQTQCKASNTREVLFPTTASRRKVATGEKERGTGLRTGTMGKENVGRLSVRENSVTYSLGHGDSSTKISSRALLCLEKDL